MVWPLPCNPGRKIGPKPPPKAEISYLLSSLLRGRSGRDLGDFQLWPHRTTRLIPICNTYHSSQHGRLSSFVRLSLPVQPKYLGTLVPWQATCACAPGPPSRTSPTSPSNCSTRFASWSIRVMPEASASFAEIFARLQALRHEGVRLLSRGTGSSVPAKRGPPPNVPPIHSYTPLFHACLRLDTKPGTSFCNGSVLWMAVSGTLSLTPTTLARTPYRESTFGTGTPCTSGLGASRTSHSAKSATRGHQKRHRPTSQHIRGDCVLRRLAVHAQKYAIFPAATSEKRSR